MEKLLLFAPQWQDSGKTKELYEGAYALRDYTESISDHKFTEIAIDDTNTPVLENDILGYSLLYKQLNDIKTLLAKYQPERAFTLGGGCGIEIPIVSYFYERHNDLVVFWFDAHGDLNSPESSVSRHFHGMPLRFLVERQKIDFGLHNKILPANRIILIGTRDLDPPEIDFIQKENMVIIENGRPEEFGKLQKMVALSGKPAYIHIDLDVIDPSEYPNVKCPTKKGMGIEELVSLVKEIQRYVHVVGYSIVENTEKRKEGVKRIEELLNIGLHFQGSHRIKET